jgi:hypothetical protein
VRIGGSVDSLFVRDNFIRSPIDKPMNLLGFDRAHCLDGRTLSCRDCRNVPTAQSHWSLSRQYLSSLLTVAS